MAALREGQFVTLVLLLLTINCRAQSSILSISAFRSCILQDFSAKTNVSGVGQDGTYLNCTGVQQNVTVLDLRITPSYTGESAEFVFNLTVVPSEANKQRTPDDPNFCGAPEGEDCVLTQTATVRISRSRAILYYQLRELYDVTPSYCHLFNQNSNTPSIQTCFGCVNPSKVLGCWGWPYFDSTDTGQPPAQAVQGAMFFKQFSNLEEVARGCPAGSQCGSSCSPTPTVACSKQRKAYWGADATSDASRNLPAVNQTLFGFDALRQNSVHGYNFNLPLPDPFPAPLVFSMQNRNGAYLQPFHCFGANCQATANAYGFDVGAGAAPTVNPPVTNIKASAGNIHITQLSPLCVVYSVDTTPTFAVTVDIEVKNQETGEVQTMTIDNITPNNRTSSLAKLISGRIIAVDTVDGYSGPAVSGLVVVCGGYKIPHSATQQTQFINQVPNAPNYNYTRLEFWDMRAAADPGSPVQDNPWDVLEDQITARAPEIDRFYPTNFQLNPTAPFDSSVMWYYIAPDRMQTMNRNCGGIAFTDLFFSTSGNQDYPNRQTAQQACLHRPDLCMPGSFDGPPLDPLLDNGIPGCLAALAFTILSNATTRAELNETEDGRSRLALAEKIARLSMPGSVGNLPTSHSYNSSAPQWFIADSNRLYYSPSGTVFLNDLSFELVLDVAADFVQYKNQISNGLLLVTNASCVGVTEGLDNNFTIGVENTGTLDQRYLVLVQCNPLLGYAGPTEFTTDLLSAGDQQFFNLAWTQSGGVPPATERDCLLTLFPGEVVIQAYLDNATVGCQVSLPPAPTFKYNGSAFPPPDIRPFDQGCDCWDFGCFESITDSWCFIGLMIFFSVLGLAVVAMVLTLVISEIRYKDVRDHALHAQKARMSTFGAGIRRPGEPM